jgi:hypothetical protein
MTPDGWAATMKSDSALPAPPPLEIQYPLCPLCGNEVDHDGDGFRCYPCAASWPDERIGIYDGQWSDPDAPRCESIDGRFLPGGQWAKSSPKWEIFRCLYPAGHGGDHSWYSPFATRHRWADENAATPEQLDGVSS